MPRPLRLATVLVSLALALGACTVTPCEQRRAWRNESTTACQACIQMNCETARNGVVMGPFACAPEFACVARCVDQSEATCGCIEMCLRTPDCTTRFDTMIQCVTRACDMPCR